MAATKPLTTEAIALTEKKMDMTLDDIIKMSKTNTTKPKKQQQQNQRRVSNKSQSFLKTAGHDKSSKIRRYMDSRSSVRQGALAQRRSNFQGNQFEMATEVARKAASAPFRNRAFSYNQVANWKARAGAPPVQRRFGNQRFASKPPQQQHMPPPQHQHQHQQGNTAVVHNQRPQTLDSLFANMKEERMRNLSQKNHGLQQQQQQRHRGGHQRPFRGRGRFGN